MITNELNKVCECGNYRAYQDEIKGRTLEVLAAHPKRCINCLGMPIGYIRNGVGDKVERVMDAIGVTAAVKKIESVTGYDCGCGKRKDVLNKL